MVAMRRDTKSHESLAGALEARILSGELPAGARLPPEQEQARRHGVTLPTIRRAMAMLEEKGLILRQRRRGTTVADRGRRMSQLVYVGPLEGDVFDRLLGALSAAAQREKVRLTPINPALAADTWRAELDAVAAEADAVIVHEFDVPGVVAHLAGRPWRTVEVVNWMREAPGLPVAVGFDYAKAVALAVQHLQQLGHTRIAFLTHDWTEHPEPGDLRPPGNRGYALFQRAVQAAGLAATTSVIRMPAATDPARAPQASLQCLAAALSVPERPTAILCDGDHRAASALLAAARLGLEVPADLSLIGIGNTPWSRQLTPALTSVCFQAEAVAELALRLCLGPPPPPLFTRVMPRVAERGSTREWRGK